MSRGTRTLLALFSVVVAAAAASPGGAGGEVTRSLAVREAVESGVLKEINTLRRQHGLRPLRLNLWLRSAADKHSVAMARRGFFSHSSADGTSFARRLVPYYRGRRAWAVGENLLWAAPDVDPATALRMWLNSPSHRQNLLEARWREVGVSAIHVNPGLGVYNGLPVTVVTVDFGVRR